MNEYIGEKVVCGSNLGSSQINEPVLSINDYGDKENLAGVDEVSIYL